MTGFARQDGGDGSLTWTWEAKSVNGRNLDIRCRVPLGYEALEAAARATAPKHCVRGNLQLSLSLGRRDQALKVQVNRALLDQLIALSDELAAADKAERPRLDALLAVRGVVETVEEEETPEARATREAILIEDLTAVLKALAANRREEGSRLGAVVAAHLDTIAGLVEAAATCAATQPEALRERLRTQVAELLETQNALPEERLAQEAALLAAKADVREELDRLRAHVAAARDLLKEAGAIGRRLDFLCQEFNREANTLCAKSTDVELTRLGLDMKTAVDQLREQVQNLE